MSRTVFVTSELSPSVPGGAGSVVAELSRRLVDAGRDVLVLLLTEQTGVVAPRGADLLTVSPPPTEGPAHDFVSRSRAVAETLAEVVSTDDVERVEFHDFDGLGFWALSHREELGLAQVPLTVRFHGPVDLMWEAIGSGHDEWHTVRQMERETFATADEVVVPLEAWRPVITERYGVEPERVVVSAPPVPDVPEVTREADARALVAIGRLGEVKGSHDLVDAAVPVLREHPDVELRLVGADGWSASQQRPMQQWLAERIPDDVRARIRFTGHVTPGEVAAHLAAARAVVVASRFESFCLAAHEARRAGLPVVVPDLTAFAGLGEQQGFLRYDGSVAGLSDALRRALDDDRLVARLAQAPAPAAGDPLAAYSRAAHEPRHPRVQAGLATAAVKRVEATLPQQGPSAAARAARALLRAVPEPAAHLAVRVLPRSVKDRFRGLASWPEEAARREAEEARRELRARIDAGEFPVLDRPDVTVVIPCYDQGAYVEDAIASVFRQTFASWEIVVVDDGSTDAETLRVLDSLDLPRVRVLRQDNRGLPGARNAGMQAARGRYLVPLDADDELTPRFLERLVAELEAAPDAAYAHCWAELFGEVSAIWVSRPWNPYQLLLSNSVVGCVLLRRDAWEAVGGYAQDMVHGNEDWDLWLRLLDAGWGQVEVRQPLFRYRKHGVSMSVETEARFEEARRAMPARHPGLYARERVLELKARHYPWVSVLVADDADAWAGSLGGSADVQLVPIGDGGVDEAVRRSAGKFVLDGRRVRGAGPSDIDALAAAAERAPGSVGARPAASTTPVPLLWRRWSLIDPGGPAGPAVEADVALHVTDAHAEDLRAGVAPSPTWQAPDEVGGTPVQRQRPEEDGPIPDWLRAHWEGRP